MYYSKSLIPLNQDDFKGYILFKTIEFTVYIKLSEKPILNSQLILNQITNPSQYDLETFKNLYGDLKEIFIIPNTLTFSLETINIWDDRNPDNNFVNSNVLKEALNNLVLFLNRKSEDIVFILIAEMENAPKGFQLFVQPYYIFANPSFVDKEITEMTKDIEMAPKDLIIVEAYENYSKLLPKANQIFLDRQNPIAEYLSSKMAVMVESALEKIEQKTVLN
ncbi:hypothetical protein [Mycoplasma struthionis]|uniref:Uncharacterized protein n=1 Tax=Mycoplasma struthionis TaxID=538220 RepID=A0A3G8LIA8_9MOLU|nr:hypothetical protein [Mycoplasma struthionis]AZG68377.1 hypothetical protein EGN60_00055 [Mycoplasma struthionis]AZG68388.1 hypothetical protein EGN60_00115 [Mycoplasma struthionis]AZG68943.1 hypothetical protein EGN60_03295 [Mycoplasma struthionis]AZG68954.1 hypothetical protein EGN60_03355 [Mycoplasma struthionis]